MNDQELLPLLSRFIINNEPLEKLQLHLTAFNPLKVLKMNHYEIRHSNVLGWLLDPNENHNLNDTLLKKFIIEVLSNEQNGDKTVTQQPGTTAINEAAVFSNHFLDAEVYREWYKPIGNSKTNKENARKYAIDIVIVSNQHKFVLLIENKIHAGEGKNQLPLYLQMVEAYYPGYTVLPVFLTLSPDTPPSDERYFAYSHWDWYNFIKKYIPLQKDRMSGQAYQFIDYYIQLLAELTEPESKQVELCKEIYKEHKQAVEQLASIDPETIAIRDGSQTIREIVRKYKDVAKYIKQFGEIDAFQLAMQRFIQEHPELVACGKIGKTSHWCYPREYDEVANFRGLTHANWTYCPYPVPIIFGKTANNGMYVKVEVGHCKDTYADNRMKFIMEAERQLNISTAKKPKINQMKKKTFTELNEKDWDNDAILLNVMKQLYEGKFETFVRSMVSCVTAFKW